MQIQLCNKVRMLLEDERNQEDICVQKYQKYAQQAVDPQLKQLCSQLATEEQHHYDMLNQILHGQQPTMTHNNQANSQTTTTTNQSNSTTLKDNQNDKMLCSDLLATEKYVSGTYDTVIFQAANPVVKQALQHIQKDEQTHGEQLSSYMSSHGMN